MSKRPLDYIILVAPIFIMLNWVSCTYYVDAVIALIAVLFLVILAGYDGE
jgi:hypothetical protein